MNGECWSYEIKRNVPNQVEETRGRHSQQAKIHHRLVGLNKISRLFSVCFAQLPHLYLARSEFLSYLVSSLSLFPFQTVHEKHRTQIRFKYEILIHVSLCFFFLVLYFFFHFYMQTLMFFMYILDIEIGSIVTKIKL